MTFGEGGYRVYVIEHPIQLWEYGYGAKEDFKNIEWA